MALATMHLCIAFMLHKMGAKAVRKVKKRALKEATNRHMLNH